MYCYIPLFVMGDLCDGGPPPLCSALIVCFLCQCWTRRWCV